MHPTSVPGWEDCIYRVCASLDSCWELCFVLGFFCFFPFFLPTFSGRFITKQKPVESKTAQNRSVLFSNSYWLSSRCFYRNVPLLCVSALSCWFGGFLLFPKEEKLRFLPSLCNERHSTLWVMMKCSCFVMLVQLKIKSVRSSSKPVLKRFH